jgi:hypothetical protein
MASKKSSSKVTVILGDAKPKNKVTRYDNEDEGAAMSNAYISNDAIKKLGNPDEVKITIEAA